MIDPHLLELAQAIAQNAVVPTPELIAELKKTQEEVRGFNVPLITDEETALALSHPKGAPLTIRDANRILRDPVALPKPTTQPQTAALKVLGIHQGRAFLQALDLRDFQPEDLILLQSFVAAGAFEWQTLTFRATNKLLASTSFTIPAPSELKALTKLFCDLVSQEAKRAARSHGSLQAALARLSALHLFFLGVSPFEVANRRVAKLIWLREAKDLGLCETTLPPTDTIQYENALMKGDIPKLTLLLVQWSNPKIIEEKLAPYRKTLAKQTRGI